MKTGRELPHDLKDFKAPEGDPFQIIPPDLALILLGMLAIYCLLLFPELISAPWSCVRRP